MKIVWMRSHPGTTLLGARLALGIPASKIYEELWHIQRHLEHGAQGEGSIDTRAPAGTKLRNEMQDTLRQMERGVPQVPHGYKTSGERPPLVLRAFRDLLFRITCWDGTRFTHEAILGTDLEVAARHVDRLATYPAKLGRSATGRRKGWELPVVEQPYTPDFLTRADEPPIKADIAAIFGLEDKELRWESLWNNIKTKLERAQLPGTDHDYVVIDLGESDDRLSAATGPGTLWALAGWLKTNKISQARVAILCSRGEDLLEVGATTSSGAPGDADDAGHLKALQRSIRFQPGSEPFFKVDSRALNGLEGPARWRASRSPGGRWSAEIRMGGDGDRCDYRYDFGLFPGFDASGTVGSSVQAHDEQRPESRQLADEHAAILLRNTVDAPCLETCKLAPRGRSPTSKDPVRRSGALRCLLPNDEELPSQTLASVLLGHRSCSKRGRGLLLLGPQACGKTTTMLRCKLFMDILRRQQRTEELRIPIYFDIGRDVGDLHDRVLEQPEQLLEIIWERQAGRDDSSQSRQEQKLVTRAAEEGRLLLMLDDLWRVNASRHGEVVAGFAQASHRWVEQGNVVVVSARPSVYQDPTAKNRSNEKKWHLPFIDARNDLPSFERDGRWCLEAFLALMQPEGPSLHDKTLHHHRWEALVARPWGRYEFERCIENASCPDPQARRLSSTWTDHEDQHIIAEIFESSPNSLRRPDHPRPDDPELLKLLVETQLEAMGKLQISKTEDGDIQLKKGTDTWPILPPVAFVLINLAVQGRRPDKHLMDVLFRGSRTHELGELLDWLCEVFPAVLLRATVDKLIDIISRKIAEEGDREVPTGILNFVYSQQSVSSTNGESDADPRSSLDHHPPKPMVEQRKRVAQIIGLTCLLAQPKDTRETAFPAFTRTPYFLRALTARVPQELREGLQLLATESDKGLQSDNDVILALMLGWLVDEKGAPHLPGLLHCYAAYALRELVRDRIALDHSSRPLLVEQELLDVLDLGPYVEATTSVLGDIDEEEVRRKTRGLGLGIWASLQSTASTDPQELTPSQASGIALPAITKEKGKPHQVRLLLADEPHQDTRRSLGRSIWQRPRLRCPRLDLQCPDPGGLSIIRADVRGTWTQKAEIEYKGRQLVLKSGNYQSVQLELTGTEELVLDNADLLDVDIRWDDALKTLRIEADEVVWTFDTVLGLREGRLSNPQVQVSGSGAWLTDLPVYSFRIQDKQYAAWRIRWGDHPQEVATLPHIDFPFSSPPGNQDQLESCLRSAKQWLDHQLGFFQTLSASNNPSDAILLKSEDERRASPPHTWAPTSCAAPMERTILKHALVPMLLDRKALELVESSVHVVFEDSHEPAKSLDAPVVLLVSRSAKATE